MTSASKATRSGAFAPLALCFALSGAASLVHQVVWMRQLTLLFGATTGAAATTLAVFFLGLALGGAWAGRRAGALRAPLRRFAALELAIAALAPLVFVLGPLQDALPLSIHGPVLRVALAAAALLPASFAMGATFPTLAEALLRGREAWGGGATLLYACNTVGAAVGAFVAAFFLPEAVGYRATLALASLVGVVIAGVAFGLHRAVERERAAGGGAQQAAPSSRLRTSLPRHLLALAAASGALALALEVAWTRMFQWVLQNSVYTYALVVVAFLVALALGSFAAHILTHTGWRASRTLSRLLLGSGILVWIAPRFFGLWYDIPGVLSRRLEFWPYVLTAFLSVAGLVVIPTLVLGAVFPYLMKVGERRGHAGAALGRLAFWNTLGAAGGAIVAGFVLVPILGGAATMVLCGGVYIVLALFYGSRSRVRVVLLTCLLGLVVAEGFHQVGAERDRLRPRRYDKTLRRYVPDGEVLATYASAMGTVAVTRRGPRGPRRLRLDRGYTLGSSSAPEWERLQAHLPLALHPSPQRVYFAGLGTGITAGGAVVHEVETITAVELVPEVIEAARDHYGDLAQGLFADPRVRLVAGDARQVLRQEATTYDVIISDLFLPWKRGVASLFAREHLEAARARLAPGGLYAQWLPLYQLSRPELEIIARTFVDVFPNATAWHGDFFNERPILCLIGRVDDTRFDLRAAGSRMRAMAERGVLGFREQGAASLPWLLHVGALAPGEALGTGPLETEDHPVLAFLAPRLQRARSAGKLDAIAGEALLAWCGDVRREDPQARAVAEVRTESEAARLRAGLALYAYSVKKRSSGGPEALAAFRALMPAEDIPELRTWVR